MAAPDPYEILSEAARVLRSARRELWRRCGPSDLTTEMGEIEAEARAAVDAADGTGRAA